MMKEKSEEGSVMGKWVRLCQGHWDQKGLKRKVWVCVLAVLMMVLCPTGWFADTGCAAPYGATAQPDHILLTWQGDGATSQTITWRTDNSVQQGVVEYQADDGWQTGQKVIAATEELATPYGVMHIHTACITGLRPDTVYRYRVGDGKNWSEPETFRTAGVNAREVAFLVFGDSQSYDYGVWGRTLHNAYQAWPGARFFVNLGDLVDRGQDYAEWQGWFMAVRGVGEKIPVMPVIGNHEYYSPGGQFSPPVFFTAQIKLPQNGPEGLRGQVYSFDYGDVHFVMLDSQAGEGRRFFPDMLQDQQTWLAEDLRNTRKKWKLVFFHRPPYSNRDGNEGVREAFVPIIDQYHADVVFNGHEHVYARSYPLYQGRTTDNFATGTVYVTAGRSGTKTYHDVSARSWNAFYVNPTDSPNYLAIYVKDRVLTVAAYKQNGEIIDSWQIEK